MLKSPVMKPIFSRPPRRSRADHLVDWLGRDSQAANILATAQQHLALKALVGDPLPPALRQAFDIVKADRGTLTLVASNAAVGAKLRQLAPRIASHLQAKGRMITEVLIKVSIQPGAPTYQKPEKTARPLDSGDLKSFEALKAQLQPGPLADAVARLLAHHSGGSSNKVNDQDN